MSELAVGALADRPRLKNITHQRQTLSLVQIEISRRTVRAPGADRPPLRTTTQLEKHPLWYKVELKGWTIHAPWAGLPFILQPTPETPFLVQKLNYSSGPSAHLGRTVRQPTRASASSLERARTVRPSGADCPPLLNQLSNLVYFKSFQNAVSPHACN